jgi:uncharacterized protein YceK
MRVRPLLFAAALASGCGTVANMKGQSHALMGLPDRETRAFGGVANDVRWVGERGRSLTERDELEMIPVKLAVMAWFVVDLPFSLAGDIVTLPKVLRDRNLPSPPPALKEPERIHGGII